MVVKCNKCELHFGYTEEDTKCPFCQTEYGEKIEVNEKSQAVEKVEKEIIKTIPPDIKKKDETIGTPKESFKIWKDNS